MREPNNKMNRYVVNVYRYADDMQMVRRGRKTELVLTCFCCGGWKVLGAASSEHNTRFPNLEGSHFGMIWHCIEPKIMQLVQHSALT